MYQIWYALNGATKIHLLFAFCSKSIGGQTSTTTTSEEIEFDNLKPSKRIQCRDLILRWSSLASVHWWHIIRFIIIYHQTILSSDIKIKSYPHNFFLSEIASVICFMPSTVRPVGVWTTGGVRGGWGGGGGGCGGGCSSVGVGATGWWPTCGGWGYRGVAHLWGLGLQGGGSPVGVGATGWWLTCGGWGYRGVAHLWGLGLQGGGSPVGVGATGWWLTCGGWGCRVAAHLWGLGLQGGGSPVGVGATGGWLTCRGWGYRGVAHL